MMNMRRPHLQRRCTRKYRSRCMPVRLLFRNRKWISSATYRDPLCLPPVSLQAWLCSRTSLIEYWSIDPDYDGVTFRSTWQDYRENMENDNDPLHCVYKTRLRVPHKESRKVCIKAVDVFGFESQVVESV